MGISKRGIFGWNRFTELFLIVKFNVQIIFQKVDKGSMTFV